MAESIRKSALVAIGNGAEEIETVTVVDLLRRAQIEVTLASTLSKITGDLCIVGRSGITLKCDTFLEDVHERAFDAFVLPGGLDNAISLGENDFVKSIIRKHIASERLLAAICASTYHALDKNGFLTGYEATGYPAESLKLKNQARASERLVVSRNLITSQSPGTAAEFSLAIIEKLLDQKQAMAVAKAILHKA